MKIFFNAITLLLIMDPLGNIPPFLSALKKVEPDRRRKVLVREILIAYVVLLFFLSPANTCFDCLVCRKRRSVLPAVLCCS